MRRLATLACGALVSGCTHFVPAGALQPNQDLGRVRLDTGLQEIELTEARVVDTREIVGRPTHEVRLERGMRVVDPERGRIAIEPGNLSLQIEKNRQLRTALGVTGGVVLTGVGVTAAAFFIIVSTLQVFAGAE